MSVVATGLLAYQAKGIFPDAILIIFPAVFVIHFFFSSGIYEEEKSKGIEFLTTTPYCRRKIILGKYLSTLLCFFLNITIIWLCSLVVHQFFPAIDFLTFSVSFLSVSLYISIFVPVHLLFGAKKMRIIAMVCVIALPYLIPWIFKSFFSNGGPFSSMIPFPLYVFNIIIILASLVFMVISYYVANYFFMKKDL